MGIFWWVTLSLASYHHAVLMRAAGEGFSTSNLRLFLFNSLGIIYSFGSFDHKLWRSCKVVMGISFYSLRVQDGCQLLLKVHCKQKLIQEIHISLCFTHKNYFVCVVIYVNKKLSAAMTCTSYDLIIILMYFLLLILDKNLIKRVTVIFFLFNLLLHSSFCNPLWGRGGSWNHSISILSHYNVETNRFLTSGWHWAKLAFITNCTIDCCKCDNPFLISINSGGTLHQHQLCLMFGAGQVARC